MLISSLAPGGAEQVTVRFLARARERAPAIRLATLRRDALEGPRTESLRAADVHRDDLGFARLVDPLGWRRYRKWARGRRLVHAHGQDASIVAALLRPRRSRLIITRHVLDEPTVTPRQRVRATLSLWAARRADRVVAVSSAVASWLEERGVDAERLVVIPNGVELSRLGEGSGSDAEVAPEPIADRPPTVLVPAMLRAGKGHADLLRAWPRVLAGVPAARLLIAGAGELEEEIARDARRLGDSVQLIGLCEDLGSLYQSVFLVVLASVQEALPTVLIEAAAAGVPVVATRVGGTEEVVVHGETGLLVEAGDPRGLALAIIELLGDRQLAARMGAAARDRAVARFDLDRQLDATLDLWRSLLA